MITTSDPLPCQEDPTPFDAVLDRPNKVNVEAAKAICATCEHREPCYLQALTTKATGVHGGRLLLLEVKRSGKPAPLCVSCREPRGLRSDRQGWAGGHGMCDNCYQADWRARRGQEPQPWKQHRREPLDPVRIERAICGEPILLNVAEREAAVELLHGKGLSSAQIAFLLHLGQRTVLRIRARIAAANEYAS